MEKVNVLPPLDITIASPAVLIVGRGFVKGR